MVCGWTEVCRRILTLLLSVAIVARIVAYTVAKNPPPIPHSPSKSFLRKQESILLQGGNAALVTPPLAAFGCEIPAFAGMVCGCTEVCGCILALLLSADNCRPHSPPKYAADSSSPSRPFLRRQESHSVVWQQSSKYTHTLPSPGRPFLRKQESHNKRRQQCGQQQYQNTPPILRPQVDHSCVGRNLFFAGRHRRISYAAVGGIWL